MRNRGRHTHRLSIHTYKMMPLTKVEIRQNYSVLLELLPEATSGKQGGISDLEVGQGSGSGVPAMVPILTWAVVT